MQMRVITGCEYNILIQHTNMADIVIGARIEADSSGANQSVQSFRTQLRDATEDLVQMNQKFGSTSAEAQAAAKRVAELRDAMGDAKLLADTFNPDKKFVAFGQAVSGVAAGFAGLQGAMGLFGVESQEVEKTLLKVQSAMALSEGISGVFGSIDAFKLMATTIKTQVVTAFSTLRGAIIATGIGALAVAIGLVVANFDKVKQAVLNLFPGLGKLASFIGGLVQDFTDFVGITSESARQLEQMTNATNALNSALDGQIRILEAVGGKEAEIFELRKQRIENERQDILRRNADLDKATDEDRARLVELNTDLAVLDAQENRRKVDAAKKASKDIVNNKKEEIEELKKLTAQEERDLYFARLKAREELEIITQQDIADNVAEREAIALEEQQKEFDRQKGILENRKMLEVSATSNIAEQTRAKVKLREEEKAATENILQATANSLTALADLAGRQTVAGKVLAIAQATINTYLGASKAIAQGGIFGVIQAVGVIAAGLAQVRNIAAVRVPGQAGGGGTPQIQTTSPVTPQTATAAGTQIDANAINNTGNAAVAPMQAFVIAEDVSNQQQQIALINRAARIK